MLVRQGGTLRQRRGAQSSSWLGALPSKYTITSVSIFVAIVAAVYAIIFQNYRVNTSIDTQFYLSFSYNYCVKGIDTDVTFGSSFPFGMGGTIAFGKLAAIVQ
jgi:hypothetical protein